MRIKTSVLQNLVRKVSKCGVNKNIGITEYYYIQGKDGQLSVLATDGVNYIKAKVKEEVDDIDVIVQADTFAKIVDKTSKDVIELELEEDCLQLVGNGTYKIQIYTGEEYPQPDYSKFDNIEGIKVGIDDIKSIGTVNKSAVSNSPNAGALNGYLLSENGVVTTDERRICFNDRVKSDEKILLSREIVNLINSITDVDVVIKYIEGQVLIESEGTVIFGVELEGKEMFPDVSSVISRFKNKVNVCTINKSVVTKALERIAIFVSPYDKGELVLISEDNILQFQTFEDSYEEINIPETQKEKVEVGINSTNLKELLNGIPMEQVKLGFVDDIFVTLEVPHIKIALATVED